MKTLWIFLLITEAAFSQQPQPPFSDIYIKPALSPYLMLSNEFDLPYQMSVVPLLQQQKQQRELNRQKEKINKLQNPKISYEIRSTGHNAEYIGIRPTGHKTTFGNLSHYYQGLP
jgi:hypothetical protein